MTATIMLQAQGLPVTMARGIPLRSGSSETQQGCGMEPGCRALPGSGLCSHWIARSCVRPGRWVYPHVPLCKELAPRRERRHPGSPANVLQEDLASQ